MTSFFKAHYSKPKRGAALLLVITLLALMAALMVTLAEMVVHDLEVEGFRTQEFRATQAAECGLAVGLHPAVKPWDPVLTHSFEDGAEFSVRIKSEQGKLNINYLISQNDPILLDRLLSTWGLTGSEKRKLIACMLDWTDANDLPRVGGAELSDYLAEERAATPSNRSFQTVEEISWVIGAEVLEERKPDWRSFFTVYGNGVVDVNSALIDVLQAAMNITYSEAEAIVNHRSGPDLEPETEDDVEFKNLSEVRILIGMSPERFNRITRNVTVRASVRRIESRGTFGDLTRTLVVITNITQSGSTWLAWSEE